MSPSSSTPPAPHRCPYEGCPASCPQSLGWASQSDLYTHIHNIHLVGSAPPPVPPSFLRSYNCTLCPPCGITYATGSGCPSCEGRMRGRPISQPPKRAQTGSIPPLLPPDTAPEHHPVSEASAPQVPLPSVQAVLSTRVPTSGHIPKGARSVLGEVFVDVLKDFNATQSQEAWVRLLLLPKCVLGPCRGGHSHTNAFLRTILSRLDRWKAGDTADLWSEATTPRPQPPALHSPTQASASSPAPGLSPKCI